MQFRVIVVTDPQTLPQTDRTDYNTLRRSLARSVMTLKKCSETQTLRAGCSKAEPKIFAPPQTPSRGRGTAKI